MEPKQNAPTSSLQSRPNPPQSVELIDLTPCNDNKYIFSLPKIKAARDEETDEFYSSHIAVGKLFSTKEFTVPELASIMRSFWSFGDKVWIAPLERNIFRFLFTRHLDKRVVLSEGPIYLDVGTLVIKDWTRLLQPREIDFTHVESWVTLSAIPPQLCNMFIVQQLRTIFQKFEACDLGGGPTHNTKGLMRVKADLNLSIPLIPAFLLDREEETPLQVKLDYGNVKSFCLHCGRTDHVINFCPNIVVPLAIVPAIEPPRNTVDPLTETGETGFANENQVPSKADPVLAPVEPNQVAESSRKASEMDACSVIGSPLVGNDTDVLMGKGKEVVDAAQTLVSEESMRMWTVLPNGAAVATVIEPNETAINENDDLSLIADFDSVARADGHLLHMFGERVLSNSRKRGWPGSN